MVIFSRSHCTSPCTRTSTKHDLLTWEYAARVARRGGYGGPWRTARRIDSWNGVRVLEDDKLRKVRHSKLTLIRSSSGRYLSECHTNLRVSAHADPHHRRHRLESGSAHTQRSGTGSPQEVGPGGTRTLPSSSWMCLRCFDRGSGCRSRLSLDHLPRTRHAGIVGSAWPVAPVPVSLVLFPFGDHSVGCQSPVPLHVTLVATSPAVASWRLQALGVNPIAPRMHVHGTSLVVAANKPASGPGPAKDAAATVGLSLGNQSHRRFAA